MSGDNSYYAKDTYLSRLEAFFYVSHGKQITPDPTKALLYLHIIASYILIFINPFLMDEISPAVRRGFCVALFCFPTFDCVRNIHGHTSSVSEVEHNRVVQLYGDMVNESVPRSRACSHY